MCSIATFEIIHPTSIKTLNLETREDGECRWALLQEGYWMDKTFPKGPVQM